MVLWISGNTQIPITLPQVTLFSRMLRPVLAALTREMVSYMFDNPGALRWCLMTLTGHINKGISNETRGEVELKILYLIMYTQGLIVAGGAGLWVCRQKVKSFEEKISNVSIFIRSALLLHGITVIWAHLPMLGVGEYSQDSPDGTLVKVTRPWGGQRDGSQRLEFHPIHG